MKLHLVLIVIISFFAGMYLFPSEKQLNNKTNTVTNRETIYLPTAIEYSNTSSNTSYRTTDEQRTIDIYKQSHPSVVFISTVTLTLDPFDWFPEIHQQKGSGSGIIIDAKEGIIITNLHVIQNAHQISIILNDGQNYDAKLLGFDQQYDLAVLKLIKVPKDLTAIPYGNSANLEVGQRVLAIGNPFGLNKTLTTGIISSLDRTVKSSDGILLKGLIQTDAAINPGNSGGPLLDYEGKIIGINTAILSQSGDSAGIGFAIPINKVKRILPELIATGKVLRVELGIVLVDTNQGPMVRRVMPNSIADKSGIEPIEKIVVQGYYKTFVRDYQNADLLYKINNQIVTSKEQAEDIILELDPKKEVVLELKKGGKLGKSRIVQIKPELK